jgi:hypothetical protein
MLKGIRKARSKNKAKTGCPHHAKFENKEKPKGHC